MKGEAGRKKMAKMQGTNYVKTYADHAFDKIYNLDIFYKSFKTIWKRCTMGKQCEQIPHQKCPDGKWAHEKTPNISHLVLIKAIIIHYRPPTILKLKIPQNNVWQVYKIVQPFWKTACPVGLGVEIFGGAVCLLSWGPAVLFSLGFSSWALAPRSQGVGPTCTCHQSQLFIFNIIFSFVLKIFLLKRIFNWFI